MPNEQKTQQSPWLGRSNVPQPGHSKKKRQASVGMVSRDWCPQDGQARTLSRMTVIRRFCRNEEWKGRKITPRGG